MLACHARLLAQEEAALEALLARLRGLGLEEERVRGAGARGAWQACTAAGAPPVAGPATYGRCARGKRKPAAPTRLQSHPFLPTTSPNRLTHVSPLHLHHPPLNPPRCASCSTTAPGLTIH